LTVVQKHTCYHRISANVYIKVALIVLSYLIYTDQYRKSSKLYWTI